MKGLDEKGFVFLDDTNRPYLCAMWNDSPWLFYWHPDNHWVSLRPVTQAEIFGFPNNLTPGEQQAYWDQHEKYNRRLNMDGAKDRRTGRLLTLKEAQT